MINVQASLLNRYPHIKTIPKPLLLPFVSAIKKIIHENDINLFLEERTHAGPFTFVESVLEYFDFSYKFSSNQIENIPATGRVVIIANHPLGALDALSLIHLVKRVRSDIKIVANDMLTNIEQLQPILVGVNTFGEGISKTSVKEISNTLEKEEVLIVFPSGEVSRARPNGIKDTQWQKGFLKFAKKSMSPIVPIHINARNSSLFYTLSSLNKSLSSILLAHEMFKQKKNSLEFHIGESIPYKNYNSTFLDTKSQVKLFKKHLYRIAKGKKPIFNTQKCIAHPEDRQSLKKELKKSQLLGQTNDGKIIYLYEHQKASIVLQEISRLREYTFRKVEEGTGKKRDKDAYDYYYKHIILWDDDALEIVGSYRIAESNFVYANYTEEGFYTNSLFGFTDKFEPYLNNAIELGRSFVQPKYWGSRALDYLWQGIGAYLYENEHIKYLFGAVTLSGNMSQDAQELIIYYYDKYYGKNHELLKPKNKFKFQKNSLDDLAIIFKGQNAKENLMILREQLTYYGTSIPTLYKQYADLCEEGGISFMGYNIDKDFENCIDSFILVEVDKMKEKKKNRYLKSSSNEKR
ncbi:MAG: Putative hemolysin [uncultured Sulfurovum sp.]|uniref:Hemolysin n=1 Tax=uncultured Sulfurovum sp. TaxID=269237 RepID=A0A6S6U2R9_9BACT|nr:MAG: Putative hemolysin [uncultured Sulfurovum sp.]